MMARKMQRGELPLSAYVESNGNTAPISMEISNAGFGNLQGYKEVLTNKLVLSNNTVNGDKGHSKASVKLPANGINEPTIHIEGNATVETVSKHHFNLELSNGAKKVKVKSTDNLFAVVRIAKQRVEGYDFIDVLFGEKGRDEVTIDGKKDRPHIAFYTEGNGKYIRLAEYKCKVSQNCTYINHHNILIPKSIQIDLIEYNQDLKLELLYNESENLLTVSDVNFVKR